MDWKTQCNVFHFEWPFHVVGTYKCNGHYPMPLLPVALEKKLRDIRFSPHWANQLASPRIDWPTDRLESSSVSVVSIWALNFWRHAVGNPWSPAASCCPALVLVSKTSLKWWQWPPNSLSYLNIKVNFSVASWKMMEIVWWGRELLRIFARGQFGRMFVWVFYKTIRSFSLFVACTMDLNDLNTTL